MVPIPWFCSVVSRTLMSKHIFKYCCYVNNDESEGTLTATVQSSIINLAFPHRFIVFYKLTHSIDA
jgi:hypothetical protein